MPVFPISCFNLQQRQQELTLWAGRPLWLWAAQGRGLPPQLPSSVANRSSAPGPALRTEQLGSLRQLRVALCCETPAVSHFLCRHLRNLGAGTRQYRPMQTGCRGHQSVNSLTSLGEGPHLEGRCAGQGEAWRPSGDRCVTANSAESSRKESTRATNQTMGPDAHADKGRWREADRGAAGSSEGPAEAARRPRIAVSERTLWARAVLWLRKGLGPDSKRSPLEGFTRAWPPQLPLTRPREDGRLHNPGREALSPWAEAPWEPGARGCRHGAPSHSAGP